MVVIQQYYTNQHVYTVMNDGTSYKKQQVCLYVIKYIYYISVEVYTALNEYPSRSNYADVF